MAKYRRLALVVFLALTSYGLAQSSLIENRVSVFASADVSRTVSQQRMVSCLQQLAQQWSLSQEQTPNILIFNASEKAAAVARIHRPITIRANGLAGSGAQYYEIWLVGTPKLPDIVLAVENILETHLGLKPSDQERDAVVARVARMQMDTVNLMEGK